MQLSVFNGSFLRSKAKIMKISRKQIRRIIKEAVENYRSGGAEFSSRAVDMGYQNHSNLSRLYEKIEVCDMRMVAPEKCAALLRPREEALFDDFMDVLDQCQHPECKKLLDYSYEVQSYM